MQENRLMILVAGPYRSGTGDDPARMRLNLDILDKCALEIWRKGHLPVIGEWLALPLMKQAGSLIVGDSAYVEMAYPVAERLIDRCDAVVRIGGASAGADRDVELAREKGLTIFSSTEEIQQIEMRDEF